MLLRSNRGYFPLTCHMSQSALWESEELCCIVVVCVSGLAPLCPPNATSPPQAPCSFMSLLFRLSSLQEMSQRPEGLKPRERERKKSESESKVEDEKK